VAGIGKTRLSPRTEHARRLFAGVAPQYDRMSALWSLGQDSRWRRFLVSRIPAGARVLDVATGTGMVARELVRRGCTVVGLDQSEAMVRKAGSSDASFVLGQAERLPFGEESFDAVTFTYLLRYVDDPGATLAELGRVLRPGGTLACLEFGVPSNLVWRAGWWLYTRLAMPAMGALVSPAWAYTGRFLGRSITRFYRDFPLEEQGRMWRAAGFPHPRFRPMSLGVGIVIWGLKADG
jgi:demethylmenaquinone methyltransferase/2-methoxy-6-polyprenyl-1,4-benzoquinol methylase